MREGQRREWWPVVDCDWIGDLAKDGRNAYLEHLNERDREVQVGDVTANKRKREHDTNGDDSAQVDLSGHGNLLARVQDSGEAGKTLGHQSRETQVPCCKDNGCSIR